MTYNCLIVDDEPLARKVIELHLQSFPQLVLRGSLENATAAFELLHAQNIDLMFLDVQMPLINGLQFVRSMKKPPAVIFTTAYSEYAAESYTLDAIDYLVKPISFERFEQGVNKFLKIIQTIVPIQKQFVLVKEDGKLAKVFINDIRLIESRKDYLVIYTTAKNYVKHMTMKSMEDLLPVDEFKRVHRSFIVANAFITGMYNNSLEIDGKIIPIGEKYRKEVVSFFKGK